MHFGEFSFKHISHGSDTVAKQYYSTFSIDENEYEFRTSSLGDYVDLDIIMPVFDSIVNYTKSGYMYAFTNVDAGQVASLVFADKEILEKAVDEGYPCSLPNKKLSFSGKIEWPKFTVVELESQPKTKDLKEAYFKTFQEFKSKGYNVPYLTINRLYIDEIYEDDRINIAIDGWDNSSHDRIEGAIECFNDPLGVVFAYLLVKEYGGKPVLYNSKNEINKALSKEEFMQKVEQSFDKFD